MGEGRSPQQVQTVEDNISPKRRETWEGYSNRFSFKQMETEN